MAVEGTALSADARAFAARRPPARTTRTTRCSSTGGTSTASGERRRHPLRLPDGGAILVVRGWVPFAFQEAPVAEAAPPAGDVSVEGTLVQDEGDGSDRPDAVGGPDPRRGGIASTLPYDVAPLPLRLTDQTPPQPGELPRPEPAPELSQGPHLSYAIQWFSFAVIALVGAVILLRRDRRATAAP